MTLYGIALLPLIEHLRVAYPDILQQWYADNGAMHGRGSCVAPCFQEVYRAGPMFRYYPKVKKSSTIYPKGSQPRLKAMFLAADLKVKWRDNSRYMSGHVGLMVMLSSYVEPKVANWVHAVKVLAHIAVKYPQSACAGLTILLQAEWQHLSHTVPGVEGHLQPIEDAILGKFILALMGLVEAKVDNDMRALFANSVKQGGLNLRDPVATAPRHRESSLEGGRSAGEVAEGRRRAGLGGAPGVPPSGRP